MAVQANGHLHILWQWIPQANDTEHSRGLESRSGALRVRGLLR